MTAAWTPGRTGPTHGLSVFLPTLTGGGAERSMITVAYELSQRGHDVDLVVGNATGDLGTTIGRTLPLVDLDRPHLRHALPALCGHLRRRRPAILLATLEHGIVLAAIAAAAARTGTVVVPRLANTLSAAATSATRRDRMAARAAQFVYRRAPCTIAVSQGAADDLRRRTRVAGQRLRVAPNPVVGRELWLGREVPLPHPWFAADEPPVVLGVGRLEPQKNFELLVQAFARVRRRRPLRLVILGEGRLRQDLRAAAADAGVGADVDLPGFDPNPFRYMARAAVHVLSSNWEGLPGSLIQALACGAPVVATDCPSGPREILANGRHGRLVPPGDAEALSAAIEATIASGRQPPPEPAWQPYTVDRAVDAYEAIVDELVGRDGARHGSATRAPARRLAPVGQGDGT